MYKDRDFDLQGGLPSNEAALRQDLELDTLLDTMADGDKFLLEVAKKALLRSLGDPEAIRYRQNILTDCREQPSIIREMYSVAVEAIEREKKVWGSSFRQYPEGLLRRSLEVLDIFMAQLKLLRRIADAHHEKFHSEGLTRLFDMLTKELNDDYLSVVEGHFRQLEFRGGLMVSAQLGEGNKGTQYLLRKYFGRQLSWMERLLVWAKGLLLKDHSDFTYQIPERDESGFRALSTLRDRGVALVASALGRSTDHILNFFGMLRLELGFYIACLNLYERLAGKGESICIPEPLARGKAMLSGRGVYDVSLSLSLDKKVVGNDLIADGKLLVMITGANRGGKSTFLRGLGQAQLMMQCGMFVAGEFFRANVCDGIFTHFKREEDTALKSGKFDEELDRMSLIVDHITSNSMILLNESFASTNEREGSEIARQIIRALMESDIKVLSVTHLFNLAQGLYSAGMENALFLRAERLVDGQRTFRLEEGEPLPTSYGQDLYRRIFGEAPRTTGGGELKMGV